MARRDVHQRYQNRVRICRLQALVPSEADLSRRTGIPRTVLSELENNRRFLCIQYALLLVEALGCRLEQLYERRDLPAKQPDPGRDGAPT